MSNNVYAVKEFVYSKCVRCGMIKRTAWGEGWYEYGRPRNVCRECKLAIQGQV